MSLEELCARTIGSLYSAAYNLANGNSMLLNYRQLSVPVIANVLNFFNVSLSNEELETIARTSGVYSKEASGTRAFVADTGTKQRLASDLVREMSERWASEPYRLLEQHRDNHVNPVILSKLSRGTSLLIELKHINRKIQRRGDSLPAFRIDERPGRELPPRITSVSHINKHAGIREAH